MARKPVMAGNWKMNKCTRDGVYLAQEIADKLDRDTADVVDVIVCPPFVDLKQISTVIALDKVPMSLGAQNCHWEESGAYTGEVSPEMVREVGCDYCIIGHSERRQMFGETDETVNLKLKALIAHKVKPILCCGEDEATKDAGDTEAYVCGQIEAALADVDAASVSTMLIAYEPIWAIGTGRVPTPEAADEVCGAIRATVERLYDAPTADAVRILYGGSMKPENAGDFLPMADIDGGLIGGAALDATSFTQLIAACK